MSTTILKQDVDDLKIRIRAYLEKKKELLVQLEKERTKLNTRIEHEIRAQQEFTLLEQKIIDADYNASTIILNLSRVMETRSGDNMPIFRASCRDLLHYHSSVYDALETFQNSLREIEDLAALIEKAKNMAELEKRQNEQFVKQAEFIKNLKVVEPETKDTADP